MQRRTEEQRRRLALEDEVKKLQAELEGEETLRHVLQYALDGPMLSHPCLSSFLPPHVQVLLSELVMIEEEIFLLERKVDELKLKLCQERAEAREREIRQQKRVLQQQNNTNTLCEVANNQPSRSRNYEVLRQERVSSAAGDRRSSLGSASYHIRSLSFTASNSKLLVHINRKLLLLIKACL